VDLSVCANASSSLQPGNSISSSLQPGTLARSGSFLLCGRQCGRDVTRAMLLYMHAGEKGLIQNYKTCKCKSRLQHRPVANNAIMHAGEIKKNQTNQNKQNACAHCMQNKKQRNKHKRRRRLQC
jgi:hypothetical protein